MNYGTRFRNGSGGGVYQHRKPKGYWEALQKEKEEKKKNEEATRQKELDELDLRIQKKAQLVRDLRDAGQTEEMLNAIKELNQLHGLLNSYHNY